MSEYESCANCGYEIDAEGLSSNDLCPTCFNAYDLGQLHQSLAHYAAKKEQEAYPCSDSSKFHNLTDFADWVHVGIENGWITEPFCDTHNGDPCRGVLKIIDKRLR